MEHLRCVVERITYQNAQNGYTVLKVKAKGFEDLVTATGTMADVHVGSVLHLEGRWRIDARYGKQFTFEKSEEVLPASVYGIEKYLGSGLIKGIGPKMAQRIVRQFGEQTLEVIENEPERLAEISGIGETRIARIKESWQEQKEIRNIMIFLQGHDVSSSHAAKIYKAYGAKSIETVTENPYRLADDIWGIGFRTADTIAQKLGFAADRYERLRSGIMYTINRLGDEGHCYAERKQLIEASKEILEADPSKLEEALERMIQDQDMYPEALEEDQQAIWLPPFYYAETGCVKRLNAIRSTPSRFSVPLQNLEERISKRTGISYDPVQIEAVRRAVTNKIMILTGGPGTGKTTTVLGIITAFKEAGARILLAAPTGRAAKRLSQASRMEASTIHRLLEMKPPEGYGRNEDNPLNGDVLIVDECSMIDLLLMYSLLKAVPDQMRLILVGDADQLPSVGAGNVFRDLMESGQFALVRLNKIFRQAQTSRIIMNAHRINRGEAPDLSNSPGTDFFFSDLEKIMKQNGIEEADSAMTAEEAAKEIVSLVSSRLPKFYHLPPSMIQVLAPMQRGAAGAAILNQKLQEALNPASEGLRRGGTLFKVHDKVMQIRNNYEKEVFNGDTGTVESLNMEERTLTVRFEEKTVSYELSELDELVLAYAATIHKSQGSEYPVVVMPVLMSHFVMLERNLIYTGITRAKKGLVLVGTKKALSYAVRHVTVHKRNTRLRQRLTEMTERPKQAAAPVKAEPQQNPETAWHRKDLFERIAASKFRSSFKLKEADLAYIKEKGMDTIRSHAKDIIAKRLAPSVIPNDGKQTPMRGAPHGHPVFLAQHATGTCCRGCLEKWHRIPKGRKLSESEQERIVNVIMEWIARQMK